MQLTCKNAIKIMIDIDFRKILIPLTNKHEFMKNAGLRSIRMQIADCERRYASVIGAICYYHALNY